MSIPSNLIDMSRKATTPSRRATTPKCGKGWSYSQSNRKCVRNEDLKHVRPGTLLRPDSTNVEELKHVRPGTLWNAAGKDVEKPPPRMYKKGGEVEKQDQQARWNSGITN